MPNILINKSAERASAFPFVVVGLWALLAIAAAAFGLAGSSPAVVVLCVAAIAALPLGIAVERRKNKAPEPLASPADEEPLPDLTEADVERAEAFAEKIGENIQHAAAVSSAALSNTRRVQEFEEALEVFASSISSIDSGIGVLREGIEGTTAATAQTASAVEEIAAAIHAIGDECVRRRQGIDALVSLAAQGQKEMEGSRNVFEQVNAGIEDLRGFVAIIDDIASRTNLLAMNAAIQAAHAGEAGRGFAVVANEVRNLAKSTTDNSAHITKRIKVLIDRIGETRAASQRTGTIFSETESRVREAAVSYESISRGNEELERSSREILSAVSALRRDGDAIKETSRNVKDETAALASGVNMLGEGAAAIRTDSEKTRTAAVAINAKSLALAQGTIENLKAEAEAEGGVTAVLLTLQHLAWIARVRAILDGTLALKGSAIAGHHECDLGRWFDAHGTKALPDSARRRAFESRHEELHALAKKLAALKEAGKPEEAERGFPELVACSLDIVAMIRTLELEAASRP